MHFKNQNKKKSVIQWVKKEWLEGVERHTNVP